MVERTRRCGVWRVAVTALETVCCATALLGCLDDNALRIECSDNTACAADELCRAKVCVSRAEVEAIEDAGGCVGPQCVPCDDCDPAPNELAICDAGLCTRRCIDGFVDLDANTAGCDYSCVVDVDPVERCDGRDNNCDGLLDAESLDLVVPVCVEQRGVCAGTVPVCDRGAVVACGPEQFAESTIGAYEEGSETRCDARDNNCDGAVDERCCGARDPREILSRGAGWEPLRMSVAGERRTVWALHREGHGRRGALASWFSDDGAAFRALLDGAVPLCDVGEVAVAAALDAELSTLAVACATGVTSARVVVRTPDGATVLSEQAIPRAPARLRVARIGARVVVAAEFRTVDGRGAGVSLVWFNEDDAAGGVRAIGAPDAGSADVIAASDGIWVAALSPTEDEFLVEYLTASLETPAASAQLAAQGSVAIVFAAFGADAAMFSLHSEGLRRSLLRREGGRLDEVARGDAPHGFGGAGFDESTVDVVEQPDGSWLTWYASAGQLAVSHVTRGLDEETQRWGVAPLADIGRRAVQLDLHDGVIVVVDGRAPDGSAQPADTLAAYVLGADGGLLCD